MEKDELVIILNALIEGLEKAVEGLGGKAGKAGKTSKPEPDEPETEAEEPEEKEEAEEPEEKDSDTEPEEEEEEKPSKRKAKADEEEEPAEEPEEKEEEESSDKEEEPAEEEEEKPRKKKAKEEEPEEEEFDKKDEITSKERKLLDAFVEENSYTAKDMREDLEAFFEGSKDVFEKRVYDRVQKDPSDAEVAWLWANKLWVNFVTDDGVVAPAKTSYRRNKRLYHCARAWHKGEKCAICGAKRKADEAPAPEPKKGKGKK